MKKVLYPILAIVVFLVMQCIAGIVLAVCMIISKPECIRLLKETGDVKIFTEQLLTGSGMGWAITLSGLLTIGIIAMMKMINWKTVLNFGMIDWKTDWLAIAGGITGIFVLGIFEELLNLPNDMEDLFTMMSNTLGGALSIAILSPIIEEFIFREGILGHMLRNGMNKWGAITASALIFGIIHMNPAQIPFAAGVGFILGIIYYKTGNIVIPCILHILNNSVATAMMYTLGEEAKDYSILEEMGGAVWALPIVIIGATICHTTLRKFWTLSKTNITQLPEVEHEV